MKRSPCFRVVLVVILSGALTFGQSVSAAEPGGAWTGNLNLFVGQKLLDEDDWAPVEDHYEGGIESDFRPRTWPVNVAVDFLYSGKEETLAPGTRVNARTWEADLGVRKIWENIPVVHPFLGGGLAIVNGEVEAEVLGVSASEDDTGLGFWLDAGVKFAVTRHFNLGLEVRYSKADVTIGGVDADAGGFHYGALLGYHW